MAIASEHSVWLNEALSSLVRDSKENYLEDFGGQAIFDTPLVGVADGEDEVFEEFRTAVSERHIMPAAFLKQNAPEDLTLDCVRVVVWVLPFTKEIRRSNRGNGWPSRLYSLARNNGGALNKAIALRLAAMIAERGWLAAVPSASAEYDAFRSAEHTFASTWSERHVAYAAGLGQFGLSAALITPVGSHVRFGSLVTNFPVEPSPRRYDDYRAPCLKDGGAHCGRCIERCPVGAISAAGMDRTKCYAMRNAVREECMETYTTSLKILPVSITQSGRHKQSHSLGCALCQCGVPCEGTTPEVH